MLYDQEAPHADLPEALSLGRTRSTPPTPASARSSRNCTAAAEAFRRDELHKHLEAKYRGRRYLVERYDLAAVIAETLDHEVFESSYADLPERAPLAEIEAEDRLGMMQRAWLRWRDGPRPDGAVGYVVFDHLARLCEVEHFDSRTEGMSGLAKQAAVQ